MTWFSGIQPFLAKEHLNIAKEIGHGQGGVVYEGILSTRQYGLRPVAIKQLKEGTHITGSTCRKCKSDNFLEHEQIIYVSSNSRLKQLMDWRSNSH